MTNQRDQLVTGVLAVALTAAFAAVVYVPQQHKIRRLRADAAALRAEVERREARVAGMQALEEQIQRVEAEVAGFEESVPPAGDLGPFLEQVTDLAATKGVVDPDIEPLAPLTGPPVEALPIQMTFTGGFASVYGFLQALESLPRLTRVSRLELSRTGGRPDLLEGDVTVQVYYQHRAGEDGIGG